MSFINIVLDVFKLIQRDHTHLSSYKLDSVSEHFLSANKDDLDYITMFRHYEDMINEEKLIYKDTKCYDKGMPNKTHPYI